MIQPEDTASIRNCIVRANLAIHRGQVENVTRELQEALAIAERVKQQQQPAINPGQPKLF